MESFQGEVRSLTFKGLGVVEHPSGQVFFVRGVWPGDIAEFVITSKEKKYGFAILKKLVRESEDRVASLCSHLGFEKGLCSGCPWMIANYDAQLREKEKILKHILKRFQIQLSEGCLRPIIPSEIQYGYRNRAQLKTNGSLLGYVSAESNAIADVKDCVILKKSLRDTLQKIRSVLPNNKWKPSEGFNWNFIDIDEDTTELSDVEINKKRVFRQANESVNFQMKKWLSEKLKNLNEETNVLELFCGSGNFTEVIASFNFKNIFATEISVVAIENLKEKKELKINCEAMDIYNPVHWSKIKKSINPDILVLDPPREGFADIKKFISTFTNVKKIIYISCDPNSWARDIKNLINKGFLVKELTPIDQFPHTPHVEILSVLESSN